MTIMLRNSAIRLDFATPNKIWRHRCLPSPSFKRPGYTIARKVTFLYDRATARTSEILREDNCAFELFTTD